MATETYVSPRTRFRWYPRWTWKALVALAALALIAMIVVEVVEPLSMGLPIGWGHYDNAKFHLRVGAPLQWAAVADSAGSNPSCALYVVFGPGFRAPQSSLDVEKMPRSIEISVVAPCLEGGSPDMAKATLWKPTGQEVSVAGMPAPIEIETVGAPQVSYSVGVKLHDFDYSFMLNEPSESQAQRDMPDFLTMARSFRYINV